MIGTPDVTVAVTAHNEGRHIGATFAALARDPWVHQGRAEVLLVDDRSTDDTVAQALAAMPGLRVLRAMPDPVSALTTRQQALDVAFREARGSAVLLMDADSRPPEGWVARMASPILERRVPAMAGPVGFLPLTRWTGLWQSCDAASYFLFCRGLAALGARTGVFFGNFAVRQDLHHRLGGFAGIGAAVTEDLAFAQALGAAGHRIAFLAAPARIDVHSVPDLTALVARTRRVSQGPASALALALSAWHLSLLVLLLGSVVGLVPLSWLLLRWALGVALLWLALLLAHRDLRLFAFAPLYEPGVLALTILVLLARRRAAGITWGGRRYGG